MNQPKKSIDQTEKIKMRPTKSGWMLIFLLVWLPLSAIGTANNFLILVFTLAVGLAFVSDRLGRKNIRALQVARRFPDEIFADTPFALEYLLKCSEPALSLNFQEQAPLEGPKEGVSFPKIDSRGNESFRGFFTTRSRGDNRIGEGILESCFPFGLALYSRRCAPQDHVLVFPKIVPVSNDLPAWVGTAGSGLERNNPFGTVPYYFRDYVAGDPYKNIEWKKSARTGSLVTKVLAEDEAMEIIIRLPKKPSEKTISKAASLVVHFSQTRTPICLQGPGLNLGPAKGREFTRKLLTILAKWEDKATQDGIPNYDRGAMVQVNESGELHWTRPGEKNAGR